MRTAAEAPSTRFATSPAGPAPAEWRGLERDEVRLLVGRPGRVSHARFRDLPDHLSPGDLLVVNTSPTLAGEVDARIDGEPVVAHLGQTLDRDARVLEVRTSPDGARPVLDLVPGTVVRTGAVRLVLEGPWPATSSPFPAGNRWWRARVAGDLAGVLAGAGRPVSYGHLDRRYPLAAYQTVFADPAAPGPGTGPAGSAEMASAGRPFTTGLVTRLVRSGVAVAPVTLHTGLSSQEAGEAPGPEWFSVPPTTAAQVNATRARGGRVVTVGTTATRALESSVRRRGSVAGSGWTARVVTPGHPPRLVSGLLTGWHDPHASHLLLVEAVAGPALTQRAYDAAVAGGYLWHEFGDAALLLP